MSFLRDLIMFLFYAFKLYLEVGNKKKLTEEVKTAMEQVKNVKKLDEKYRAAAGVRDTINKL